MSLTQKEEGDREREIERNRGEGGGNTDEGTEKGKGRQVKRR